MFTAGLASSWHCIGMCGGFPVMLAGRQKSLARQVVYNLVRVNTLVFIGALSGAVGASIVHLGPLPLVERGLPIVAGVLMMIVGAEMLGLGAGRGVLRRVGLPGGVAAAMSSALRSRSIAAPVALGVFNAFLPCHLVYAFAARAASTGSVLGGMATMLWFGLGTVPAMLLMGRIGGGLPASLTPLLTRLSAIAVVLFGVWTFSRAFVLTGAHSHHAM